MKLFQKMSNNRARCLLCPRYCEMAQGHIGACHARVNRGGEIIIKDYGAISSVAVEPIEKKPFKHFLPGTKTLSVGGWGCNLMCLYCLPPDSLISTPSGTKRIDQIQGGDEIYSLDNSNSNPQLVVAHVGGVFDRESEEVIVIEIDGGRLELTPEHPVMTKSRGWVKAEDLTLDDEVLCDKTCL